MNDGGPAYPVLDSTDWNDGMTLLDHFAALAMQGMIGNAGDEILCNSRRQITGGDGCDPQSTYEPMAEFIARNAYEFADAMLAERARRMKGDAR